MTPSFMVPPICTEQGGDLACNRLTSVLEVAELHDDPPARLFCYPGSASAHHLATTWMGDAIGRLAVGRIWRDNFGGERCSVRIYVRPGLQYVGTMFNGSYIRARRVA